MSARAPIPKLERLLRLAALLLDTERPLTAEQIREGIGAYAADDASFRRAFERDKDDLREMGIPVETAPVPGTDPVATGYRILPEKYYLDDPGLDAEELAALRMAMTAVRMDAEVNLVDPLRKLGGAGSPGDDEPLARLPTTPAVATAFAAVAERRRLVFDYGGSRREVRPLRLDFTRGHWYLSAWDESRDDDRVFRLDRVEGEMEAIGEPDAFPSTARPEARLEPWRLGEGEPRRAVVRFDAGYVTQARQQLGDAATVRPQEDGSAIIELDVTNTDAFRSFVLGFLDHAEVLEPPELRDDIVGWLEALA